MLIQLSLFKQWNLCYCMYDIALLLLHQLYIWIALDVAWKEFKGSPQEKADIRSSLQFQSDVPDNTLFTYMRICWYNYLKPPSQKYTHSLHLSSTCNQAYTHHNNLELSQASGRVEAWVLCHLNYHDGPSWIWGCILVKQSRWETEILSQSVIAWPPGFCCFELGKTNDWLSTDSFTLSTPIPICSLYICLLFCHCPSGTRV